MTKETTQTTYAKRFDFRRHWKRKIVPLLNDPGVVKTLTFGLQLHVPEYREGDPPWEYGRGPWNGQRARRGCLSWYQPWGRCHWIAPFCWALGRKMFPDLEWGFITGDLHTVVIGWRDDWENPEWVMDILLFKDKTADESLAFVKSREWTLCRSLAQYLASFSNEANAVLPILQSTLAQAGIEVLTNGSSEPVGRELQSDLAGTGSTTVGDRV